MNVTITLSWPDLLELAHRLTWWACCPAGARSLSHAAADLCMRRYHLDGVIVSAGGAYDVQWKPTDTSSMSRSLHCDVGEFSVQSRHHLTNGHVQMVVFAALSQLSRMRGGRGDNVILACGPRLRHTIVTKTVRPPCAICIPAGVVWDSAPTGSYKSKRQLNATRRTHSTKPRTTLSIEQCRLQESGIDPTCQHGPSRTSRLAREVFAMCSVSDTQRKMLRLLAHLRTGRPGC